MWSLTGSQAVDQPICCFGPGSHPAGWSAAQGLSHVLRADPAALGLSRTALGSKALGLWVGQLASAPSAHPPEVSGVDAPPRFQLWAPSPLIWECATGLQVSAGAAYPAFTVQGLRGERHQRPGLLRRVL